MGNEPSKSRTTHPGAAGSAPPESHGDGIYAGPPPLQHAPEGAIHGHDAHTSKNAVTVPEGAEVIGNYLVEHIIGKGSFAEVKLGRNIKTGEQVALKVILKANLNKGKRRVHLQREIRYLKLLCHPHIAVLYEVVEQEDNYVLIMEHASGGELLHYIRNADKHRLKESESRRLFRQIVSAVDYCHKNFLIHRDIKPENILLDANCDVKIIDFGFSREFTPEMQLDSFIGSPHYAAPELLQGIKYSGPEVDRWSLGILLYVMICGKQPFKHPDMKVLYAKITKGEYEMPDHVSPEAADLIQSLLQLDPHKRASMESVRNHKWLNIGYPGPPPTHMSERGPIVEIDQDLFSQLLAYGFEADEAEKALQANQPNIILNFYHLLREKQRRDAQLAQTPSEPGTSESESEDERDAVMVRNVDTDEVVSIKRVERNIRRQIMRRQSSQPYSVDKRTEESSASKSGTT